MTIFEKLQTLAKERGLEVISVNSGRYGHPDKLKPAVTGFKNIRDAEHFAAFVGDCEVVSLYRHDNWKFWEVKSDRKPELFDMVDVYFKDCASLYFLPGEYKNEKDFIDEEIKSCIEIAENIDDMIKVLQTKKRVWEAIENMGEDEMVLEHIETHEVETIKRYVMHYNEDIHNYTIAVVPMA